jgi:hypothetical protein
MSERWDKDEGAPFDGDRWIERKHAKPVIAGEPEEPPAAHPADSTEALEAGLRLMLREANAEGHRSWQFIRAKCNELLALQASGSEPLDRLTEFALTVLRMHEDGHPDDREWFEIIGRALGQINDLLEAAYASQTSDPDLSQGWDPMAGAR